jgi:hypothetical protein
VPVTRVADAADDVAGSGEGGQDVADVVDLEERRRAAGGGRGA